MVGQNCVSLFSPNEKAHFTEETTSLSLRSVIWINGGFGGPDIVKEITLDRQSLAQGIN